MISIIFLLYWCLNLLCLLLLFHLSCLIILCLFLLFLMILLMIFLLFCFLGLDSSYFSFSSLVGDCKLLFFRILRFSRTLLFFLCLFRWAKFSYYTLSSGASVYIILFFISSVFLLYSFSSLHFQATLTYSQFLLLLLAVHWVTPYFSPLLSFLFTTLFLLSASWQRRSKSLPRSDRERWRCQGK